MAIITPLAAILPFPLVNKKFPQLFFWWHHSAIFPSENFDIFGLIITRYDSEGRHYFFRWDFLEWVGFSNFLGVAEEFEFFFWDSERRNFADKLSFQCRIWTFIGNLYSSVKFERCSEKFEFFFILNFQRVRMRWSGKYQ